LGRKNTMNKDRFKQAAQNAAKTPPAPLEAQRKRNEHMDRAIREHFEDSKPKPEKEWNLSNRLTVLGIIVTLLFGLYSVPALLRWLKE